MNRVLSMPGVAPRRAALASGLGAFALAALIAALAAPRAEAAEKVPSSPNRPTVDVWINKEEGGVFTSGEKMQVFFRSSHDAYVLIYNIDTEGYIHLIYPFRPDDPMLVQGGETYRVPSRHDPYDLVAEGPVGMEYVVAIASPLPFQNLPWYLAPGSDSRDRADNAADDEKDDLDQGVIVGDPYVGMENLHRRIVPPGHDEQVATDNTFFYIERRVEYPRYVCADCHHRTYWFDPYVDNCNVVDIRIDATWARYAPVYYGYGPARPRYYYQMRPSAPPRFQGWKERWSSLDGSSTLRQRFVLEREAGTQRVRTGTTRREVPPEFKDLRRYRPGRFWQGRDQVIPLREARERESQNQGRDQGTQSQGRDRRSQPQTQPPVTREPDRRSEPDRRGQTEERRRPEAQPRSEERKPPETRERKEPPKSEHNDPRNRQGEKGRSEEKRQPDPPKQQEQPQTPPQEREGRVRGGR